MTPIGETLRRERLRRNLDLEQISRELKIAPRFLDAIEQEKFDRLPGNVFAKSFVRQYARVLGLDEDELAAEVQRQLEPQPEPAQGSHAQMPAGSDIRLPRLAQWETVGDGGGSRWASLPALALVVIVMLGCAGVYAWWQRSRHPASTNENSPAPAQVAQAARPATAPPQPAAAPQPVTESSADRVLPTPAASPAVIGSADAPSSNTPPAAASPLQTGEAQTPTQAGLPAPQNRNAPVQVEMTAQEPVWVRAQSDGKYLFSGTLRPNERRTVDAVKEVRLRLGNAGGVMILLNGRPVGPVGPKGQIRTVQLTPGGFKIVSAPNPGVFDPF